MSAGSFSGIIKSWVPPSSTFSFIVHHQRLLNGKAPAIQFLLMRTEVTVALLRFEPRVPGYVTKQCPLASSCSKQGFTRYVDCVPLPALTLGVHSIQKSMRHNDPEASRMGLALSPVH